MAGDAGTSTFFGDPHVAAAAWRDLNPNRAAPSSIETVSAKKPTGRHVYRLLNATENGDSVIAKRYRATAHQTERFFYQEVLPELPIRTARYYGELDADDGYAWIFLEDAGSQRFKPNNDEHRRLAAGWLGTMHVAAATLPLAARLPDRGLGHYRQHLQAGRRLILDNLGNPALRTDDVELLMAVAAQCDEVERRWSELEAVSEASPSTLIHADFRPRNVFVRGGPSGGQLLPIDWEMAGWGVPAADLAPKHGRPQVDLHTYCQVVQQRWPDFDMAHARRLVWAGHVFRRLAAVEWAAMSLEFPKPEQVAGSVACLRVYHAELSDALANDASGGRSD